MDIDLFKALVAVLKDKQKAMKDAVSNKRAR
jgi:hypothetical protein